MNTFTTGGGFSLAYYSDDFTNPRAGAPTVLPLHAAIGGARRYFGWIPHLCRQYRVVRLDVCGHGASASPSDDAALTLDRLVRDVADFLVHRFPAG